MDAYYVIQNSRTKQYLSSLHRSYGIWSISIHIARIYNRLKSARRDISTLLTKLESYKNQYSGQFWFPRDGRTDICLNDLSIREVQFQLAPEKPAEDLFLPHEIRWPLRT